MEGPDWRRGGRRAMLTAMADSGQKTALQRRALRLEYATIAWNVGEAALTIGLGLAAASLALIGFGADSLVEIFASVVVVWHVVPGHHAHDRARTARALRLVALAFVALAVGLVLVSVRDLATQRVPGESPWGIAFLAVTVLVMFAVSGLKRQTARQLESAPMLSEAAMSFLDGLLALATMIGLALNAVLGWWWADPAAALIVAAAAVNEARENWAEARELDDDD